MIESSDSKHDNVARINGLPWELEDSGHRRTAPILITSIVIHRISVSIEPNQTDLAMKFCESLNCDKRS
jgi:hypothetical protein